MWRGLMEAANATPGVLDLARDAERLAALQEANTLLERIQKVGGWVAAWVAGGVAMWRGGQGYIGSGALFWNALAAGLGLAGPG
jgi:hypothetical protein